MSTANPLENNNKKSNLSLKPLYAALFFTLFGLFVSVFSHDFFDPDDYLISIVTNRLYSSENYCIFLHPILCGTIKLLSHIFPYADNYNTLILLIYIIFIFSIPYIVFSNVKSSEKKVLFSVLFLLLIITDIVFYNFTITASFFAAGGLFILYFAAYHSIRPSYIAIGTFFVLFGYTIRAESVMLFLPFLMLHIISCAVSAAKEKAGIKAFIRNTFIIYAPLLICAVLLFLHSKAVIGSAKYHDAFQYNSARASIEDRPQYEFRQFSSLLPSEITENDYEAIKNYVMLDTHRVNSDFLYKISSVSTAKKFTLSFDTLKEIFWYSLTLKTPQPITDVFIYCVYVLCICALFSGKGKTKKAEALLAAAGSLFITMYFVFIGRLPYHLHMSILCCTIPTFFSILLSDAQINKKASKILLYPLCFILFAFGCVYHIKYEFSPKPVNYFNARQNIDDTAFEFTYSGNSLYIWDTPTYDMLPLLFFHSQNKLPTREFLKHNIQAGEWIYGQLYFKDHLNTIGIENPIYDLLYRDDVYFVSNDPSIVYKYIQENITADVDVKCIAALDNVYIWSFTPSD